MIIFHYFIFYVAAVGISSPASALMSEKSHVSIFTVRKTKGT